MEKNSNRNNNGNDNTSYFCEIAEAENIIWITTYITLCFARGLTIDQMNLWGNIFSAVGSNLSALAVLYPTVPQGNDQNNNSEDSET